MKKLTLLFLGLLYFANPLFSQSKEINEWIDSQYLSPSHKAFIYQVSPQSKAADFFMLKAERTLELRNNEVHSKFKGKMAINNDTTWTFSESKVPGDSLFRPYEYSYRWTEGEEFDNSSTNYNFYRWYADSTKWFPLRKTYSTTSTTAPEDTSTTYFYQGPTNDAYYGTRNRTVKTPTQGSDYEFYRDGYSVTDGWLNNNHTLSYQDENGYDTLRVEEQYNREDMLFRLSSESRNISNENYILSSYKYFDNNTENAPYSWSYDYIKLGQDGRYEYQLSKRLDYETKELVGEDSLQFIYEDDYVEGQGYTWQDSVWTIETLYRSYQRTFANPDPNDTYYPTITEVDSVILYSVYPDSLDNNGNIAIGDVIIRTEFDYDANGKQAEVRNFSLSGGALVLASRTVRTWELIAERYVQTHQDNYVRNTLSEELYKAGFSNNFYNDEGINEGSESFNLNAAGDTTYGTGFRSLTLEDGTRVTISLRYDVSIKKMIVTNYRAFKTEQYDTVGKYTNQSSYVDPVSNSGSRSISAGGSNGSFPVVFNDGPVNINMGDTLTLFVSARNIDFTIPEVSVTNMPSTATFNPDTKKFYWVVDNENPSPMTYTATSSKGSTSIQVPFVDAEEQSNVGVGIEEDLATKENFTLAQNYPNPFNPSTTISFNLAQASLVRLKVYNMLGQEVATLLNSRMNSGVQTVQFDASNLASGMYIYRLQAGENTKTMKMLLIK